MKKAVGVAMMAALAVVWSSQAVLAQQEHSHHDHPAVSQEQMLTGEVVDVFCYLSHSTDALGKGHADCAKKCINSGLPVALKVGDQLYLASMTDHQPANTQLAQHAGEQISVRGKVMERDGQRLISISEIVQ